VDVLEYFSQQQLLQFYGWWQFGICLFAFLALMGIWWHIGRRQNDGGQVWLAVAVLCWSLSGLVEIWFARSAQLRLLADPTLEATSWDTLASGTVLIESQNAQLTGLRSILSLLNSLFILLALPWFRYVPEPIAPVVKSRNWYLIVGLPFLFSLLPTLSSIFRGQQAGFISELDVYYALFTVLFLGYVLWSSFQRRRLPALAGLAVVCILITVVAQLYKFSDNSLDLTLYSAIFKTALIMLFFALALSWVKELSENIIPTAEQLRLLLRTEKSEQGKVLRLAKLEGLLGKPGQEVSLSPTHYELLHHFATKRRQETTEGGWLEIKPKQEQRPGRSYDINDHNQVKRLLNSLLDGLFGKGNWNRELHFLPLREALFESGERKIRLRLAPEQIEIP